MCVCVCVCVCVCITCHAPEVKYALDIARTHTGTEKFANTCTRAFNTFRDTLIHIHPLPLPTTTTTTITHTRTDIHISRRPNGTLTDRKNWSLLSNCQLW